jgi:hypothetical protein
MALASRIRSSTRACWRCRSSSPTACPGTIPTGVLVNSAVIHFPSTSVNLSCAPGVGPFLAQDQPGPLPASR